MLKSLSTLLQDRSVSTPFDSPVSQYRRALFPPVLNCISRIASVRDSEALRFLLATERSQRHYTTDDLDAAYAALGLDVSSTRKIDEELIMAAFTGRMLDVTDPTRKRVLHDACELIATSRGSDTLRAVLASMVEEEKPKMDLAKAHRVLDVPENVEEDMLLMLYDIRVSPLPLLTPDQ
jgi:ubiquitin carboxyl-terminal hydrolase 25/28